MENQTIIPAMYLTKNIYNPATPNAIKKLAKIISQVLVRDLSELKFHNILNIFFFITTKIKET